MERLAFVAEVKASGDTGVVEGYGSLFGEEDLCGDVVERGAFTNSLSKRMPRFLFGHKMDALLGVWDEAVEDEKGLRLKGRVNLDKQIGREIFSDIKMGALTGLSIGYRTLKSIARQNRRHILEVDLFEVSAVAMPMLPSAGITAAKAAEMTEREMERLLTQDAGLSRTVARRLMANGFKSIQAERDAGEDDANQIAALIRARIASKS